MRSRHPEPIEPKAAHVVIKLEGAVCPRCETVLHVGRTLGAKNAVQTETVCDVCGSILWFDSVYRLHPMTQRRWDKLDSHERDILAAWQRRVRTKNKEQGPGDGRIVLAID